MFMYFFLKGNNLENCVLYLVRNDIYYFFMYCVFLYICGIISICIFKFLKKVEFIYFMKCFRKLLKYFLEYKMFNFICICIKLIFGNIIFRIIKDEICSCRFL